MRAILTATPDLIGGFTGIFLDQQGNIPAIERAGKLDELVLIGVDGAPQNVERLRTGKLDAIVSVKARDYGTMAIQAAVIAVSGDDLPQRTEIGQCLLTAETLSDPDNAPCLYDLDKQP
jgi:ribose transport system substrate-binding protein